MIFLGGVHGVGKSSMCFEAAQRIGLTVFGASAIIRAERQAPSVDSRTAVRDVRGNQELLIQGVRKRGPESSGHFVLDGHFVLRTLDGAIERIDPAVFVALGIDYFICIQDDPQAIAARLLDRDGAILMVDDIAGLQSEELDHARYVSRELKIRLDVIQAFDHKEFEASLRHIASDCLAADRWLDDGPGK
ncbi:ATP-binding protein [Polaromonas sp.]|uniref:ATP-binding protein n=1 Tax=Polaromonas sp. TaxID=1869339 RepID=UPI00181004A2|nr:ATP-binding protein [Polaromonas sp.]NMM06120.1 AAA family ATPase [Polaromonas sp.]